jgi:hypothetical protein
MKADRVNVSWDAQKRKWMVRLEAGAEVIRRYCDHPKDADEQTLRAAATQTVKDEGYDFESANIGVSR